MTNLTPLACLLAAGVMLGWHTGHAAPLTLGATPDAAALAAVRAAASGADLRLSQPSVLAGQSFRLLSGGHAAGDLVSGRGTLPALAADANPISACFVALARPHGAPELLVTIGAGDWEAEACNGVSAVGLLPPAGDRDRAAVIYKTSAPHGSPVEPVVVSWSATEKLSIDAAATKQASLAGAASVAEVRASLK